ncbi:peroxidase family protein [Pseudophaeobacter sp.]|uniref:peroxidase family protein n=1 Tax=Pseudophaeobacter sp. TaxID=1971739 RepID=UPI003299BD1D
MTIAPKVDETSTAFQSEAGHCKDQSWVSDHSCTGVASEGISGSGAAGRPVIDFAGQDWREACIASKQHIPAGYTYLGQLIGHDMGHSVPNSQVPYAVRPGDATDHRPKRHNAIENPLTLETLYGAGPRVLPHLYDQKTQLFRINPMSVITLPHLTDDPSVRAIADARNRDVHILHRMTAIMMRYHNHIAQQFHNALSSTSKERRHLAFSLARNHVLHSWIAVIREDFLPQFLDPEVAAMPMKELRQFEVIDAITMQHGVMRAFHALPRRAYKFPELRDLGALVLRSSQHNERKLSSWPLDWSLFFDPAREGTKTGISASFSPAFRPRGGVTIDKLDARTARDLGPQRLDGSDIQQVLALMPSKWSERLAPAALARDFTQKVAKPQGLKLTEGEVKRCHIHLILMIEAQLYGENGRFGPLGSLLLRCKIEEAIANVRMVTPSAVAPILPRPNRFIQIINTVIS